MYIKYHSIYGVYSYINNANYLYINDKYSVTEFYSKKILFNSKVHLQYFRKTNNQIFINDNYGRGYFISELSYDFFDEYIAYFTENIYISKISQDETKLTVFKDSLSRNVIGEIPESSTIFFVKNNKYFRKNFKNNFVEAFLFPEGKLLWQYSKFSDFNWMQKSIYEDEPEEERQAEVEKFVGIYKDVLWLVLNSGRLLGLDVSTGELRYNLEKPINYDEENTLFLSAIASTIDTEKGILFGIKYTSYFEINLESPETSYIHYDISETCKINSLEADYPSNDLVWEGDEIFIGKNELHYEKYPCYVGVFNRKNKEIIWSSKELGEMGNFKGISKLDYAANKLYVLDRESTLHIFEKE